MKTKMLKRATAWLLSLCMVLEICPMPTYAMESDGITQGHDVSSNADILSNEEILEEESISSNIVQATNILEDTLEYASGVEVVVKDVTDSRIVITIDEEGSVTYKDRDGDDSGEEVVTGRIQLAGIGKTLTITNNSSQTFALNFKDAGFTGKVSIAGTGEVVFNFDGTVNFNNYSSSSTGCIFNCETKLTVNASAEAVVNVGFQSSGIGGHIFEGKEFIINGGTWTFSRGKDSVFFADALTINGGVININGSGSIFDCDFSMTDGVVNLGKGIMIQSAVNDNYDFVVSGGSFNVYSIEEMDEQWRIVQNGGSIYGSNAKLLRLMGAEDGTKVEFLNTFAYTKGEYIGILPENELPDTVTDGETVYTKISTEGILTNNSSIITYVNLSKFDETAEKIENPVIDITDGNILFGEVNDSLFYIQNENYVLYTGEASIESEGTSHTERNTIGVVSGTLSINMNTCILYGKDNSYINSVTALSVDSGANLTINMNPEQDAFLRYFGYDYGFEGLASCVPAPSVTIAENASLKLVNKGKGYVEIGSSMSNADRGNEFVAIVNKGVLTLEGGNFEIQASDKAIYNIGKKNTIVQEGTLAGTLNVTNCKLTTNASIVSNPGVYMSYGINGGDIHIENSTLNICTRNNQVALGYAGVASGEITIKDSVIFTKEYTPNSPSSVFIMGSSPVGGPIGSPVFDIKDSIIIADGMITTNSSNMNKIDGNSLILSTNDLLGAYSKWEGNGLFIQTYFDEDQYIRYIVNDAVKLGDSVLNLTLPADVTIENGLEFTVSEDCYITVEKDYCMINEGTVFIDGLLNANTSRLGTYEDYGKTMYSLQSPGITLHSKNDGLTGEISTSEVTVKYNGTDINAKVNIDYLSSYNETKGVITITPTVGSALIYGNSKELSLELPKIAIENVSVEAKGLYEEDDTLADVVLTVNDEKCEAYFKDTTVVIENGKKPGYDCYVKVKDEYAGDYTLEEHAGYVKSEDAVLLTVPVNILAVRELGQVMAGVDGQSIELDLTELQKVFPSVDGEIYSVDETKEITDEIKSRLMSQGKLTIETNMVTSNNYISVYLIAHHSDKLDTEVELRIPVVESVAVVYNDFTSEKTVNVLKDSFLNVPAVPVKEGYVFNGWYIKSVYVQDTEREIMSGSDFMEELEGNYVEWDFNTDKVTDFDFTLYAHWLKIEIIDIPSVSGILKSGRPVSEAKFIESTLNPYCNYAFENPDEMPQSYLIPQVLIISVKDEYVNKITLKGNLGYNSENDNVYKNIYVPFYRRIDTDGIEIKNDDEDGEGLYTVTVNITNLEPFEKNDPTVPEYTVMGTDTEVENLRYFAETKEIIYEIYRNSEAEEKEVIVYLKAEGEDETKTVYVEFPVSVVDGHIVTYDANYEGSYPYDVTYEKDLTIKNPYAPTRQAHKLSGWYVKKTVADSIGIVDEEAVVKTGNELFANGSDEIYIEWKFDTYKVTGAMTLYAGWIECIDIPEIKVEEFYQYGISLKDVVLSNLSEYCDYRFMDESIIPTAGNKDGYEVKVTLKEEYKEKYTLSSCDGYDAETDSVARNVIIPLYVRKDCGYIFTKEPTSEISVDLNEVDAFGPGVKDEDITYEYLGVETDYSVKTTSLDDGNNTFKAVFGSINQAVKEMAVFRLVAHTAGCDDVNVYLYVDSLDGHKVTYNYLDYITKDTVKMYEANKQIPVRDNPTRVGFTFAGWYISEEMADKLQIDKNGVVSSETLFNTAATEGYSLSSVSEKEEPVIDYEKDPYPQEEMYYVLWNFEENLLTDDIEFYARWEYPMEEGSEVFITEVRDINYTGSKLYPEVIVRDSHTGKVLTEGVDYKLEYKNNINASHSYVYNEDGSIKNVVELDRILQRVKGSLVYDDDGKPTVDKTKEPNVVVTGIGNYRRDKKAVVRVPFRILPASLSEVEYAYKDSVYVTTNKEGQKVKLTAKYEGKSVKMGTNKDYTVMYRKDDSEELLKTIPAKDTGLYYICVTAGKGMNFDGSIELPVVVYDNATYTLMSTATISLTKEAKKVAYTGEPISFTEIVDGVEQLKKNAKGKDYIAVKAKVGSLNAKGKVVYTTQTLTYGTDYVLAYENNVDTGKATLVVKAAEGSRFIGSKSTNFTIEGVNIKQSTVNGFTSKYIYTGDTVVQNVSLSYKDVPLTGQDYTVEYLNNKNQVMTSFPTEKGTYYLRFTGKNNFSGVLKKKFTVQAASLKGTLSEGVVSLSNGGKIVIGEISNTVFNKGGATPVVELTYRSPEGKEIALYNGVDYKLTYKNNKKVVYKKTPQIIVKGKGNFKDNMNPIEFTIGAKELSGYTINAQTTDLVYNAKKKDTYVYQPKLVLYDGSNKLKNKKDYTYTVSGNDQASVTKQIEEKGYALIPITITSGSGTDYIAGTEPFVVTYRVGKATVAKASVKISDQIFDGYEIKLDGEDFTKVRVKGKDLIYGVDYVIKEGSYQKNVNVGKATVTIIGIGPDYIGEKKVSFKITPKVIKK